MNEDRIAILGAIESLSSEIEKLSIERQKLSLQVAVMSCAFDVGQVISFGGRVRRNGRISRIEADSRSDPMIFVRVIRKDGSEGREKKVFNWDNPELSDVEPV